MSPHLITWTVAALATAGVIVRPFNLPEAIWAVAGAVLLVVLGLISIPDALTGVAKGTDVYLFLFGMMLLAEIAREEGLFAWLAAVATSHAKGSARRLFLLTYGVGTIVTIFLSNDATAVVLTPAVAAAVHTAKAEQPLPYLLICAFIANAASFVLPISNPANLVIYGSHMPPLLHWLPAYRCPRWCRSQRPIWCCVGPSEARSAKRSRAMFRSPYFPAPARPRRSELGRRPSFFSRRRRSIFSSVCPRPSQAPDGAGRPDPRTQRTVADTEGYIVGRAATRGRPLRAGRGAG